MIRPATVADLPALLELENQAFSGDRLSRRSFRHLLTRANAITLVDEENGALAGYAAVLFHRGTSLARLYSIAVDHRRRGAGKARALLAAVEAASLARDAAYMRLEVHAENRDAQRLYEAAGYRAFGTVPHYYDDEADALRMEKSLAPRLDPEMVRVPYYEQSLPFTCGPAALLMAMHSLDPDVALDQTAELRLWREATTIYMTSGHGGSSPYGLAVAAAHRGFQVEVFTAGEGAEFFVHSVRSERKRQVIRVVQQDFIDELEELGVPLHDQPLDVAEMRARFARGAIPLVLVSTFRLDREHTPHWVTLVGFDDNFVYFNDPFVYRAHSKSRTDCMQVPVPIRDFERMARYGKERQQAVILLSGGRRRKGKRRR